MEDSMQEMDVAKEIHELKRRLDQLELRTQAQQSMTLEKKKSPREFLLSTRAEDSVQKTLVLAYFLERYEGQRTFTVKDLERRFHLAKERVPSNTNDMVNKNIQKGFMMEAEEKRDNKKSWCLTNPGVTFVDTNLIQKENPL